MSPRNPDNPGKPENPENPDESFEDLERALRRDFGEVFVPFDEERAEAMISTATEGQLQGLRRFQAPLAAAAVVVVVGGGAAWLVNGLGSNGTPSADGPVASGGSTSQPAENDACAAPAQGATAIAVAPVESAPATPDTADGTDVGLPSAPDSAVSSPAIAVESGHGGGWYAYCPLTTIVQCSDESISLSISPVGSGVAVRRAKEQLKGRRSAAHKALRQEHRSLERGTASGHGSAVPGDVTPTTATESVPASTVTGTEPDTTGPAPTDTCAPVDNVTYCSVDENGTETCTGNGSACPPDTTTQLPRRYADYLCTPPSTVTETDGTTTTSVENPPVSATSSVAPDSSSPGNRGGGSSYVPPVPPSSTGAVPSYLSDYAPPPPPGSTSAAVK